MSNSIYAPSLKTALIAIVISAFLPVAVATAGQFYDRTFQAKSYPNSEDRRYTVYVPDSYDGSTPVPMVVVLHGCKQTQQVAFEEQGWHRTADRYGFIVLAPFITSYEGFRNPNCWGWWSNFDYEVHEGGGEIEDIYRIALEVEGQYNVDANQRHITGLSAGGFMANVAAVTHNEYWASAAVIEGGGYGETVSAYSAVCPYFAPRRTAGTWKTPQQLLSAMQAEFDDDYKIPMFLMHSTNDCTVGFGVEGSKWGGLTANREAWLQHNGGIEYHSEPCAGNGVSECTYKKFGRGDGRSTVETLAYVGATGTPDGKGHYFSGGIANGEWTRTDGPDTRNIVWAFFSKHGRDANTVPEISLNGSNPMRVELSGAFTDPGATATDAEDGDLTARITTSGSVDTNETGEYVITYRVTDSGDASASAERIVVVFDPAFNNAPSISLKGSSNIHVPLGSSFDDPGATAFDAEDGDLTDAISVSGSVDTSQAKSYTIRYHVTDSGMTAGGGSSTPKSASAMRTVVVDDAYCEAFTSSNYAHVVARRASVCNVWYACAVGSGKALGYNNVFITTTLYEAPQGHFSTTPCSAQVSGDGEDETVCWTDTNYQQAAAGRASYGFVMGLGYVYLATGSNDNLGFLGYASTSLRETAPDYYERVATCP